MANVLVKHFNIKIFAKIVFLTVCLVSVKEMISVIVVISVTIFIIILAMNKEAVQYTLIKKIYNKNV